MFKAKHRSALGGLSNFPRRRGKCRQKACAALFVGEGEGGLNAEDEASILKEEPAVCHRRGPLSHGEAVIKPLQVFNVLFFPPPAFPLPLRFSVNATSASGGNPSA
jgi:hypothetical protein